MDRNSGFKRMLALTGLKARREEAKRFEKLMAQEFDKLCKRVKTDANFGNSSKGKKDNFLDGAETMLILPSVRIAELDKEINAIENPIKRKESYERNSNKSD